MNALWRLALRVLPACAALALGLGAVFVALLALTLSVTSDDAIARNLHDAAERGVLARDSYPPTPYGATSNHQRDLYTDCVAFGLNLQNEADGVWRRIAASPTAAFETPEVRPCEHLVDDLRAETVSTDFRYLRFWHGYQVVLRPLLSVLSLDTARRIVALLFFAALLWFGMETQRLIGPWAWAVAIAPFFMVSDFFTAPMVMTHALSLAWAFGSVAIAAALLRRGTDTLALPLFVVASGALYNFLSFLLNPPLAPALIGFFAVAALLRQGATPLRAALYGGALSALWFAGFFAAWFEKWAFAALVLGWEAVRSEVFGAFGDYKATREYMGVDSFLGASRRNVMHSSPFFATIVVGFLAGCALLARLCAKRGDARARVMAFVALLTPLWAIVFWVEAAAASHSAVHVGFVSRSFLLFGIVPLLAAMWLSRAPKSDARRD